MEFARNMKALNLTSGKSFTPQNPGKELFRNKMVYSMNKNHCQDFTGCTTK
jgi:hypothetical protein